MKVVVVGGGIVGCATAFYLTKLGEESGVEVSLVERHEVAGQASGKAGGFLAKDWCSGPVDALAKKSFQLHAGLQEELGEDIGYRKMKTVMVSASEGSRSKSSPTAAPSWLDCSVQSASVGGTESTTAQVHPRLLTKAMLAAARRRRAEVVEAEATGVRLEGKKVTGVEIKGREVLEADAVVVAMGPWTGKAQGWFPGSGLPRIRGSRAHSVVIDAKEVKQIGAQAIFLDFDGKEPEIYPRGDGTVYVCGEGDAEALPEDPAQVLARPAACAELERLAGGACSALAGAKVLARQACYLPAGTPDGRPIIGKIGGGYTGAYVASGHTCWGILNGPATGMAMAELVLSGEAKCVDLTGFDPARFEK